MYGPSPENPNVVRLLDLKNCARDVKAHLKFCNMLTNVESVKALANGFNICFNILSILLNGNVESVCHPPSTLLKRVERMLNRC